MPVGRAHSFDPDRCVEGIDVDVVRGADDSPIGGGDELGPDDRAQDDADVAPGTG